MKVDRFENARKTRKKSVMTLIKRNEKENKKKKRSGKNYVISFPKPRMPHRIQFREIFKTKDIGMKKN